MVNCVGRLFYDVWLICVDWRIVDFDVVITRRACDADAQIIVLRRDTEPRPYAHVVHSA